MKKLSLLWFVCMIFVGVSYGQSLGPTQWNIDIKNASGGVLNRGDFFPGPGDNYQPSSGPPAQIISEQTYTVYPYGPSTVSNLVALDNPPGSFYVIYTISGGPYDGIQCQFSYTYYQGNFIYSAKPLNSVNKDPCWPQQQVSVTWSSGPVQANFGVGATSP